jgi:hypothetical protein
MSTTHNDSARPLTVAQRIAAKGMPPSLTSTGFRKPVEPTPEELIAAAALMHTPDPDAATVRVVKAAALAADLDASAILKDPGFRAKVATINSADTVAVGRAIAEARAENPQLQRPFVSNKDLVFGIAEVIKGIENGGTDNPAPPSIVRQVMAAGQAASFKGPDLIRSEDFLSATAGVDPSDTGTVAKVISHLITAHQELRQEGCWFSPTPEATPEVAPRTRDALGQLVGGTLTQSQMMAERIRAKTQEMLPSPHQPVNFIQETQR